MGGGASSSREVSTHLRKWEQAIGELNSLCREHRSALGRSPSPSEADPTNARPMSSQSGSRPGNDRRSSTGTDGGRERANSGMGKHGSLNIIGEDEPAAESANQPDSTSGASKLKSRKETQDIRKRRAQAFESFEHSTEAESKSLPCAHFAAIAAGLTYLLDGNADSSDRKQRVTVEDLFFAAHIPLHSLHKRSIELTEMFDVVREFIDVDNRFKENFTAEIIHLDTAPKQGQVEPGSKQEDLRCKVSMTDFRRLVETSLASDTSVMFCHIDPFTVEQAMRTDTDDMEDSTYEADLRLGESIMSPSVRRFNRANDGESAGAQSGKEVGDVGPFLSKAQRENDGLFIVVVDQREGAVPMVTIGEGFFDARTQLHTIEIPFSALYNAMRSSGLGGRARGFLQVARKSSDNDVQRDINWSFSAELCCGKILGSTAEGTHSHCVSPLISQHITACAWALHLLGGATRHHGHGSGLPVSDIIRTLELPSDMFLCSDVQLEQVYFYLNEYLKLKSLDAKFSLALCPILAKINRSNAVPTMSLSEFESVIIELNETNAADPEHPAHVMILQYDASIAHNAFNVASCPQWGVLAGFNTDTLEARLIDANPLRFAASWTVALDRLHTAITSYGYLVLSRKVHARRISTSSSAPEENLAMPPALQTSVDDIPAPRTNLGELRHVGGTIRRRLDLIRTQRQTVHAHGLALPIFVFPKEPLAVTMAAVALTALGNLTTVDKLLHTVRFDISGILQRRFSLHGLAVLVEDYLFQTGSANQFDITVQHCVCEVDLSSSPALTFMNLLDLVEEAKLKKDRVVVAHFYMKAIECFGPEHPFGEFGVISDSFEDQHTREVMFAVTDCNPNQYLRTWHVPATSLFKAMVLRHSSRHRSRGILVLRKLDQSSREQRVHAQPARQRHFDLSAVPLQLTFLMGASPQVQGLSMAFAQLGASYSPEEIFYEAYLKTLSAQTRRSSQAFAWRDVEVSLGILPKRITPSLLQRVGTKFLESRRVDDVCISLHTYDEEGFLGAVQEATDPDCGYVLMIFYAVEPVHKIRSFGNSVGLVETYSPTTKMIGVFEAEFSLYGSRWSCDFSTLTAACHEAGLPTTVADASPTIHHHGGSDVSVTVLKVQRLSEGQQPEATGTVFGAAAF